MQLWYPQRTQSAWSSVWELLRVWYGRMSLQRGRYPKRSSRSQIFTFFFFFYRSLLTLWFIFTSFFQISVQMIKVLLHMEDKYSIDGFLNLRQATMVALTVTDCIPVWFPSLSTHYILANKALYIISVICFSKANHSRVLCQVTQYLTAEFYSLNYSLRQRLDILEVKTEAFLHFEVATNLLLDVIMFNHSHTPWHYEALFLLMS